MAKPGVMFYFEVRPCIKRLTLEEKGQLFESILDYGEYGALPDLEGALGVAWDFIQPRLDRDADKYDETVAKAKYAAATREARKNNAMLPPFEEWKLSTNDSGYHSLSDDIERYPKSKSNSKSTSNSNNRGSIAAKPPTRPKFSPPSTDDVRSFCTENGYCIDPERFVDYYTANGWRVGKNPMKDWKAAVRSWNRSEQKAASQGSCSGKSAERRELDDDEIAAIKRMMEED